MKKEFNQMVKAIEVTKRYSNEEVNKLAELFLYLNDIEGLMDEYKYGVSAKGLWKLLKPLTRTGGNQAFRERWESVSNLSRLKDGVDYQKTETITQVPTNKNSGRGKSQQAKKGTNKAKNETIPVKEIDYILTLRAGEYCATLTKGDAGDLYRRFIFDIKDEFIRLVFRRGKSVDTRLELTNAISKLEWMKSLPKEEQSNNYAYFTNWVYKKLNDIGMTAEEYKKINGIARSETAKHYFKKDGLLDLEKIETKMATIIDYVQPKSKNELEKLMHNFYDNLGS